jgi:hypothetical protein
MMYPSHQWPPQGPVYDYPSPAPTGRANKIALIAGIVFVVIVGWSVVLAVWASQDRPAHGPSQAPVASVPMSPRDAAFIQRLDDYGLPASSNPAQWISTAHQVCTTAREDVALGRQSLPDLEEVVYQGTGIPYPSQSNGVVIGASVTFYCTPLDR